MTQQPNNRLASNSNVNASFWPFNKSQRLLVAAEFKAVFDAPERKLHQSHLMAFIRANDAQTPRIGMAITKRRVPTAVARNRLKRQIREQFRLQASQLKNKDIVFIVKNSINELDNNQLRLQINNIFNKLENKSK